MASVAQFFKNADLLRLLCKKEYLPDLRDVARLASVNQRTRAVLAGTPDLVLYREICADPDIIDPHQTRITGTNFTLAVFTQSIACDHDPCCYYCGGEQGKIACDALRRYENALYRRGNFRVALTFDGIARENSSTLIGCHDIDFYGLLEDGHFETALECALTQETVDDAECGQFFYFAMTSLYDGNAEHLAEQRFLETCKLFRHLSREALNTFVKDAIFSLAEAQGITEGVFGLLERNADKIGNVFLDVADLMQDMIYCSTDVHVGDDDQIQAISSFNADGLAYLVRTGRVSLYEFSTVLKDCVDELNGVWHGKNAHTFVNLLLLLLSKMHASNCDTEAEWRSFFLYAEMQTVARILLNATAFSPLTAELMEQRDRDFCKFMKEQDPADKHETRREVEFIDAFLHESAKRTAMDRYLEFVAARLRAGLIERAATEPQNKKQKF